MNETSTCQIASVTVGAGRPVLIAGPCLAESLELCQTVADALAEVCRKLNVGFVFKASYDKANRTALDLSLIHISEPTRPY